jgi:hypothetical protein
MKGNLLRDLKLVNKEQRRGVRADLEQLRELVMAQEDYILSKGLAAHTFGWGHSKLYSMFRQANELYQDLALVSGSLVFLGPYPEVKEE